MTGQERKALGARSVTALRSRDNIAGHAQLAWRLRQEGFYVVNSRTEIPVDGPFSDERAALIEARYRNAEDGPRVPDRMIVRVR